MARRKSMAEKPKVNPNSHGGPCLETWHLKAKARRS